MKKIFITLTALLTLNAITAQEDEIRFGAKAGLNISSISGDETDDAKSKIGFHIGPVVEIPITEKFAIQPELLFSTQGAKSEESETVTEEFFGITYSYSYTSKSDVKLNYLNLPVIAKFYVAEGLSIQAGPQIGFLLSADSEYEYELTTDGETESDSGSEDISEYLNGTDFSINLGFGYQLPAGIFFDARYNIGLSNIYDLDNETFEDLEDCLLYTSPSPRDA